MRETFQIRLSGLTETLAKYADGPFAATVSQGIQKGLDTANLLVTGIIKRKRLNGQGPFPVSQHRLGHRSRRLVRAFTASRARIVDPKKLVVASALGSNVSYFGPHEFGFSGQVKVKAHTRKSGSKVRAHLRHMRVPERAMVRTELADPKTQQIYTEKITAGITAALSS